MSQAALAQVRNTRLQVEDNSRSTTVPDDNVGRLMYYLHCISVLMDNCVPRNLTNYSQYYMLDQTERMLVIRLAVELSPDKVPVFIEVPNLPENNGNLFLKFSSLEETVTALGIQGGGAAMMALRRQVGNQRDLIQVMAYTPTWIRNNYLNPLRAIKREMEQAQERRSRCVLQ